MTSNRLVQALVVGIGLGFAVIATLFLVQQFQSPAPPEQIAEAFFIETYTRDFSSAWERVSEQDKAARTKDQYVSENPDATEQQALLLDKLAEWGEFQPLAVVSNIPQQAIVSARIRYPNSGHDRLEGLISAAGEPNADGAALLEDLTQLHDSDQIQFVEGEISFDFVLEDNEWRLAQHWGQGVTVLLEAAVSPGLPWDFSPVQTQLTAVPGELVRATYLARNNSDETITAKAIHEVGPPSAVPYFQTIECFCFTEQTLEPGEEREMTLVFRIDYAAPGGLESIGNLYTFYSLDEFPSEG